VPGWSASAIIGKTELVAGEDAPQGDVRTDVWLPVQEFPVLADGGKSSIGIVTTGSAGFGAGNPRAYRPTEHFAGGRLHDAPVKVLGAFRHHCLARAN
jgi:hypothetical protein